VFYNKMYIHVYVLSLVVNWNLKMFTGLKLIQ
jgi:hypothetical protein